MSVHKNKSNNTWYVKHRNKTKRGFKTKRDAAIYEAQLKIENEDLSVSSFIYDLADDYLKYYKTLVAYGTYRKTETIIKNIIIPNIKNKTLDMITELDCRKFREYVDSLDYSTRYKNCILISYKAIFKHAEKYFGLKKNPTSIIDPFKRTFQEKLDSKSKEMNIWSLDEFNKFINEVPKIEYKALFITLYFTGARLGEVLALQWKDLNNGKISINKALTTKTINGTYEIKDTKNTSSIRDVVLGDNLNKFLLDIKTNEIKRKDFREDWFIFGRNKPLPQTSISRVKDTAIKKAKIKRIRIHDFRHSHASNLIGDGMDIVAVSRRLGHSDINMTLKVYTHLLEKNDDKLAEYLDKTSQYLLKY